MVSDKALLNGLLYVHIHTGRGFHRNGQYLIHIDFHKSSMFKMQLINYLPGVNLIRKLYFTSWTLVFTSSHNFEFFTSSRYKPPTCTYSGILSSSMFQVGLNILLYNRQKVHLSFVYCIHPWPPPSLHYSTTCAKGF